MLRSRLLSIPAFALRATSVTAAVLSRVAEDAATHLATPRSKARGDTGGIDFLDLSGEGDSPYGTARRLVRAAPGLAEMSDGAAAQARLEGGTASDQTAGVDEGFEPPARPTTASPRPVAFNPARITSMPVREALEAIEHLSTEELHAVLDHETANRNRKTIMRAIEKTLRPVDSTVG